MYFEKKERFHNKTQTWLSCIYHAPAH